MIVLTLVKSKVMIVGTRIWNMIVVISEVDVFTYGGKMILLVCCMESNKFSLIISVTIALPPKVLYLVLLPV